MTVLPFRTDEEFTGAIPSASAHLEHDGILAHPTETIYGLGSRPTASALDALARFKGRAFDKPFLLLVSSPDMALEHGLTLTPGAVALADAFWPGPLTLVLPGGEGRLPEALRGPDGGIAVRWTAHKGVAKLVAALGYPLTSTSANRTGGQVASGVKEILQLFREAGGDDVAAHESLLVLDGGDLVNLSPSTVIDCTTSTPRLVREGAIALTELGRCGRILVS
jgi:L-threonylcarbamoyladenylate synthase